MYSKKGILAMTLALAQMSRAFENPGFINPSDPLDEINLAKEYDLIKQKKSGLSANQRKRVVYRYEKILKERDKL